MGCGVSLPQQSVDRPEAGPNFGTNFDIRLVSASWLYSYAQHSAEWPDYYCIVDMRPRSAYRAGHVVGAYQVDEVKAALGDYVHEITVIIYGTKPTDAKIGELLSQIQSGGHVPSAIYISSDSYSVFKKRYNYCLTSFKPTEGQFPGPIEMIPRTKDKSPGLYCLHRQHFAGCKQLIAYLRCSRVINLSARRLFVKTPGIILENVQFDENSEPFDEAVEALFRAIDDIKAMKIKPNILLIDEAGNDYGALLCGWYLFKRKGYDIESICEHLVSKTSELDPWYTDLLREWTMQ